MFRKLSLFAYLIFGGAVLILIGCDEYLSKASYFDGAVIVEYRQSLRGNDYLTIRFYEKGDYNIAFSRGDIFNWHLVPKNITKNIEVAPREIVIEQYALPDFLRVTITREGKSESHDFR